MVNVIDAGMMKTLFLAGTKQLESKQELINELNVFPVPDGDTGTNMTLTLMNAVKDLQNLSPDAGMGVVSKTMSQGTLRGARGNSGVILSQLVRGFVKEIEGAEEIDQKLMASGFDRAVKTAYKAVMKPKEGTILTVSKAAAEKAAELSDSGLPMEAFLQEILVYAEDILEKTPDMLPVLKEAGVVDSGGKGLVEFLRGALDAFRGKEIDLSFEEGAGTVSASSGSIDTSAISTSDIKFGYCTEFIIDLERDFSEEEEDSFKAFLSSIGDSIVCVHMDEIVKVHVHTNHPGQAIEKGLEYGSLSLMKIDNMRIEHNEKLIKESDKSFSSKEEKKSVPKGKPDVTETFFEEFRKEVGFVTVCAGEGFKEIFKGMSVDEVIEGGQTMNPSTEDIIAAIDKVNADNVFVLPNNNNIVMAANQAAAIYEDKNVIVIPTSTVCQGINAVINYIPALTIEDNIAQLTEAAKDVKTAEITYSIRDTELNGMKVRKDDYMGIGDGELLAAGPNLAEVAFQTASAMMDDWSELVTIYYGEGASEEDALMLTGLLEMEFPDADYEVAWGGQPVYYFVISVE